MEIKSANNFSDSDTIFFPDILNPREHIKEMRVTLLQYVDVRV